MSIKTKIAALALATLAVTGGIASSTTQAQAKPNWVGPAIFGAAPIAVRGRRVLIVDETCDSGATMRLAVSAIVDTGAVEVRTAVAFKTGRYEPDYHALATESEIVLPWDKEVLFQGELVPNPLYRDTIGE